MGRVRASGRARASADSGDVGTRQLQRGESAVVGMMERCNHNDEGQWRRRYIDEDGVWLKMMITSR